jgi:hypothetical protein
MTDSEAKLRTEIDDLLPVNNLDHMTRSAIVELMVNFIAQHDNTVEQTARLDTVTKIMSVKTEGIFDGPDLFIKRKPIEQVCIDLLGYEAFKAIQEAIPSVNLEKNK